MPASALANTMEKYGLTLHDLDLMKDLNFWKTESDRRTMIAIMTMRRTDSAAV